MWKGELSSTVISYLFLQVQKVGFHDIIQKTREGKGKAEIPQIKFKRNSLARKNHEIKAEHILYGTLVSS